jgi:flagellar biosynthetic protein FlhB
MSDSSDLEKTESPSPRRLAKAREEGQVARSRELATFLALLAGGAGFSAMGAQWVSHTTTALQNSLVLTRRDAFDTQALGEHLTSFATDALIAIAPILLIFAGAAIAGSALLGGFIFSTKNFSFDVSRMSPVKGLKRTWSTDGLAELVKAIIKTVLLGSISAWVLWNDRDAFAGFGTVSLDASLTMLGHAMVKDFLLLTIGVALIAGYDAPIQLWRHHKSLRMTKQELRDEARESEGDPAQKQRIRALQRQAATRRMMAEVPKADVIVVNPSHYSVAIAYNATMRAPKVIAKGSALTALRIREIAGEHHIPILEAPPLARALYKHTDLGREVPFALYEAVALVMAYVFQVKRYRTKGGAYPVKPATLPVPADLDFVPVDTDIEEEDALA